MLSRLCCTPGAGLVSLTDSMRCVPARVGELQPSLTATDSLLSVLYLPRSPRYDLSHTDVEDWVGRLLPSRLVRHDSPRLTPAHVFIHPLGPLVEDGVLFSTFFSHQRNPDFFSSLNRSFCSSVGFVSFPAFAKTLVQNPVVAVRCHRAHHCQRHSGSRGGEAQEGRRQVAR